MRAIGANERHIVKLFFLEVFYVALFGSLIGVAIGTYLSAFLADTFALVKNISVELTAPEQFFIALIGLLLGSAICISGALLPINRIKRLEPLLVIKED